MPRLHRGLVAAPLLLTLAAAALVPSSRVAVVAAQGQASPPKLLVILVMDQFWQGYVDLYRTQWTRGLKRIVDDGAVFTNAHFSHGLTLTCAGHATIGTGANPNVHGMVSNSWYDQALKKTVNCVDDPDAVSVPFGGAEGREHHSAKNLLIPTFADELRRQTATTTHPARTVSVALKPRSAIMLGGRPGPNAVVVWEEDHGAWATSKLYTNEPWPDVEAFVRTRPMAADYGAIWSLFLPPTSYRFSDEAEGEARPTPWGRTFPHTLHSLSGRPDIGFVSAWERSPWSDAFVADLAAHLVYTRKLGTGSGTDLLTVSLPSLDLVAHEYGPHSFEAQDVLARADQAIGRLLEAIERNVGPEGYVLAFSSDHGVATLSERLVAEKKDAGRISSTDYGAAIRTALNKVLGEGTYVGLIDAGQVMLMDGVLEKLRAVPNGVETLKQAMASVKGIARVYGPDDLASSTPTTDGCLQAWRLSYLPGRTGAFVGVARNDWMFKSTGTTHGTCNEKDRHVPVIFYGASVRKGRYSQPVSPADIVPTFAGLTGTVMQHLGGRSLVNDIFRTNDLRGGRRDQPSSSPKR